MTNPQSNILNLAKVLILALVLSVGAQYLLAQTTWTNAPASPPNCPTTINGCNPPINNGSVGQTKAGGLTLGTANPPYGLMVAGGKVGIGSSATLPTTPTAPLSFGAGVGNKINLYEPVAGGNPYGFGVQGNLLQMFVPNTTQRISLGYGTSAAFNPTLSVVGANVGVGNIAPKVKLDVAGTIKIGNSGTGAVTGCNSTNQGMIVYNTIASGNVGFFGCNGTAWTRLDASAKFGSWVQVPANTTQTAPSDGFVVASVAFDDERDSYYKIESPVGTIRQFARPRGDGTQVSMMTPVRKGDTWRASTDDNANNLTVYWIGI